MASLWPNPTRTESVIDINASPGETVTVQVFDLAGQEVDAYGCGRRAFQVRAGHAFSSPPDFGMLPHPSQYSR